MIAQMRGQLREKSTTQIVLDVQGIGYLLFIPLSTFYELPETGQEVTLFVYTHWKTDGMNLYGFHSSDERELFQYLIGVNGIGPKLAISVLSGISTAEFAQSVMGGDLIRLLHVPGIGRKTAQRIILELKDKVMVLAGKGEIKTDAVQSANDRWREEVLSALVNLGYKNNMAREAVDKAIRERKDPMTLDALLKQTLKYLAG